MRTLGIATATVLLAAMVGGPAAAADPVIEAPGGPTYYLALGDSLAAGYQPVGRPEDDHRTRAGYADQLWLMARARYPNLELVNLACPGESTETLRLAHDRCGYPSGSQLDEALVFIEAHRDELAFVTIDIGFNDFDCASLACLFPGIERIEERLPPMLEALQAATPGVPIVGMNVYDPFLSFWLGDEDERTLAYQSVVAMQLINEALEGVYEEAGIPVADVESAFAIDDWETLVPLAGHDLVPRNPALLCERTWQCVAPPLGPDRHPNVLGFRVIADAFAAELGIAPA